MKLSNWRQLKIRSDLVVSPQSHQGQLYYVIKDPVTLRYFRLRPTEYAIFKMLDGDTPVDEIVKRLKTLGHDVPDDQLQLFLKQLGAANFFENVLPNQAESLYQMSSLRRARRSIWSQAKRILYVKVPLVDPDRAFTRTMRHIGFFWSRWMMLVYAVLVVLALWAFYTRYEEARSHFTGLLAPQNLLALWLIFIVEKVFHELGHGLTCKRFGGEVHEMGVLILVLTPCMYCNISDAWVQEKPSRKFWISAAGIVTELVIACVATLVWWATPSGGVVNSLAYRVMLIAGLSSVLVNGNPLMKWDGYYILSDILGMPNLRENSVRYSALAFRRYVLGMRVPGIVRFDREAAIKIVYGLLSTGWIAYIMYRITKGMLVRFPALGVWVLISTLYGLVLVPVVRIAQFFAKRRGEPVGVDVSRLSAISAAVALAAYFLFFYNMGYSVSAPCVVQPSQRLYVKAPSGGILVEMPFRPGETVSEGQLLARLSNPELENAAGILQAQVEAYNVRIDSTRSSGEFIVVDGLTRERDELLKRLADTRRRIESLVVNAPFTGVVMPPAPQSQLGTFLVEGDAVCELADTFTANVSIAVSETDIKFVRKDAPASVTLRAYPWRPAGGVVREISKAAMRVLPHPALSSKSGGPVVTRPDVQMHVPVGVFYEVNIAVPNADGRLLIGMVGTARIQSGSRRLYDLIYSRVRAGARRFWTLIA